MKTWITADWHLGECRFELMGRPFTGVQEHIDYLVQEHNKLVAPDDEVIVVGDVCYQMAPKFLTQVSRFNGKKVLVRGNHDKVFTDQQLFPYFGPIIKEGSGFMFQCGTIPCYVTHYPTQGLPNVFNLVGHIHGAWKYQLNMFNVGVDANHFRPVNKNTIPFHLAAISQYYDDDVWVAYQKVNEDYRGIRGKKGTYFETQD